MIPNGETFFNKIQLRGLIIEKFRIREFQDVDQYQLHSSHGGHLIYASVCSPTEPDVDGTVSTTYTLAKIP